MELSAATPLTVLWDGQIMEELTTKECTDWLPVLTSVRYDDDNRNAWDRVTGYWWFYIPLDTKRHFGDTLPSQSLD